ncbi:Ribbon-helix-helix protein, copG family [Ectothiorhodospira mobilis]|uniref:Ribbon-helix-helix protein, copG family n=1 Tax=Ectothiorhodospira mobilis TaxID=195064 RepID=A0A1I4SVV8_ECTMO|nr:CopG family transcriptional regulator [Ectothiorhodospira mobilis]SFM68480.1 Ribbon-helix-helix protein, copG family [Ectothiorhodospira mobilis]
MKAAKTETITVRIEPAVKAGLKAMAERERRSIANMIEVMIRDYCGREGVEIPETPVARAGNKQSR